VLLPHRDGWTALVYAAHSGHARVVELLIAAGSDITATTSEGYGGAPQRAAGRAVKKRTPLQAAGCGSVLRGRRPPDAVACSVAGGLRSWWRRIMNALAWSSCSSPPAPTSLSRALAGVAVHRVAPAARRRMRCTVWQPDGANVHGDLRRFGRHRCSHRRRGGHRRDRQRRVRRGTVPLGLCA
jgi:hypothetical protein